MKLFIFIADLKLSDWSTEPDEEGCKRRNLSYTLTLNFSIGMGIGPKCSPSTEQQVREVVLTCACTGVQ
jgi:hypothetical protein